MAGARRDVRAAKGALACITSPSNAPAVSTHCVYRFSASANKPRLKNTSPSETWPNAPTSSSATGNPKSICGNTRGRARARAPQECEKREHGGVVQAAATRKANSDASFELVAGRTRPGAGGSNGYHGRKTRVVGANGQQSRRDRSYVGGIQAKRLLLASVKTTLGQTDRQTDSLLPRLLPPRWRALPPRCTTLPMVSSVCWGRAHTCGFRRRCGEGKILTNKVTRRSSVPIVCIAHTYRLKLSNSSARGVQRTHDARYNEAQQAPAQQL